MCVSVVIPVHNRAVAVRHAVQSVLNQDIQYPIDIIVVDDGSDDETPDVLAALSLEFGAVRTFRQSNGGVSSARNAGLSALLPETEFVTFLDSDDLMAEQRLAKDLSVLRNQPDAGLTYGDMMITKEFDLSTMRPTVGAPQARLRSLHMSCTLYRRSLIEHIGHFDENLEMAEDTDFIFRTFEHGMPFAETDTICHYYLRHSGNLSASFDDKRLWFSRAVLKRIGRRKANASLSEKLPKFTIQLPDQALFA